MSKERKSTVDALRLQAGAARKRAIAPGLAPSDPTGARWNRLEADDMETRAAAILALPPEQVEVGRGGELVAFGGDAAEKPGLVEAVRASPDLVTARASGERLELIADAGALDMGIDAAETIGARDSLEKMLAHQIAAAHNMAMKLAERATAHVHNAKHDLFGPQRREYHAAEAVRAANASARMMDAFQRGLLTLDRLRNGGRQLVTVQYVQIGDGGQAIVAGGVHRGARVPMAQDRASRK